MSTDGTTTNLTMLPPTLPIALEPRVLQSFDGARLTYYASEPPFPGAPTIVLANGLGGHHLAWRAQIDYLRDRYRFLTWDYRGLYRSPRPPRDEQASYAVASHVRDLEALLAKEQVGRVAFVGWSMGVQVLLESTRLLPDRAACLVLINGTPGRPFDTLVPIPGVAPLVPSVVELVRKVHQLATRAARSATRQPEALVWMKRANLIGKSLDDDVFAELVHEFAGLEMEPFLRNLRAIGEHDAWPVVPRVRVPVLVVSGDRDSFTPPDLSERMVRTLPKAEALLVRGATHYACIEYPELVNLRIERFLSEHGFV